MCIRAIDYCPPVDINFGDFLRAIITADLDLVEDDSLDYRLAFIEAFSKRGIYPAGIKHLSVESLSYAAPNIPELQERIKVLIDFLRIFRHEIIYSKKRVDIFEIKRRCIVGKNEKKGDTIEGLHKRLSKKFEGMTEFEKITGLMFNQGWDKIGIHTSTAYESQSASFGIPSLHVASRSGPTGNQSNQIIVGLMQRADISIKKDGNGELQIQRADKDNGFGINGGCTLIFDLDTLTLKYAISKPILDTDALDKGIHQINKARCTAIYNYQKDCNVDDQFQAYFGTGKQNSLNEPFNFLHNH
jgi:hypothetical protein